MLAFEEKASAIQVNQGTVGVGMMVESGYCFRRP